MNERIKELAILADAEADAHFTEDIFSWSDWQKIHNQKFAELIVRECISQAHGVSELRGANEDMIYGADTAAGRIAKHFGVES